MSDYALIPATPENLQQAFTNTAQQLIDILYPGEHDTYHQTPKPYRATLYPLTEERLAQYLINAIPDETNPETARLFTVTIESLLTTALITTGSILPLFTRTRAYAQYADQITREYQDRYHQDYDFKETCWVLHFVRTVYENQNFNLEPQKNITTEDMYIDVIETWFNRYTTALRALTDTP